MKAAVYKDKNLLVVEEVPDPKPGDDEIVMKVSIGQFIIVSINHLNVEIGRFYDIQREAR